MLLLYQNECSYFGTGISETQLPYDMRKKKKAMMIRKRYDPTLTVSGCILLVFSCIDRFRYKVWNIFATQHLKTEATRPPKLNNEEQPLCVETMRGYGYNPHQPTRHGMALPSHHQHKLGVQQICYNKSFFFFFLTNHSWIEFKLMTIKTNSFWKNIFCLDLLLESCTFLT